MAIKFLSSEWEEKMRELLEKEFSTPGGVTTIFTQVVEGCPDGETRWICYKIEKNRMANFQVGVGEDDIPESNFIASGPYNIFTSIMSTPLTEPLAESAVRIIFKNLPLVCDNGQNEEARSQMLLASSMAGMAFSNTFVHLGHSLAHVMGAHWHITHGVACALALPYTVEHVAKKCPEQIIKVGRAMDLPMGEDAEANGKLIGDAIRKLCKDIGIPTLTEAGGKKEELEAAAADVMKEFMRNYSPARVKLPDVIRILTAMFED